MSTRTNLNQPPRVGTSRQPYSWVKAVLLIMLSPAALILGVLFALSDSISRVLGHRGPLVSRVSIGKRRAAIRESSPRSSSSRKSILITGAPPIALALARDLTAGGHRVTVVDAELGWGLNRARYSRGVGRFIAYDKYDRSFWGGKIGTEKSYAQQILGFITSQRADIWIACDNWSSDEDKMRAAGVVKMQRPNCLVPFPGPVSLDLAWNKFSFSRFVKSLETGITTPASTIVRSRGQIHSLLGAKGSKRSLLLTGPLPRGTYSDEFVKNYSWRDSGFSDYGSTDGSLVDSLEPDGNITQRSYHLPLESLDSTYDLLSGLPISPVSNWDATELLYGQPCVAHALVHQSSLRAFFGVVLRDSVQYPPALQTSNRNHQQADEALSTLDPASSLYTALISFTQLFVSKLPAQSSISLTLKFIVVSKASNSGVELRPWVIGCEYGLPSSLLADGAALSTWAATLTRLGQKSLSKRVLEHSPTSSHHHTGTYSAPASLFHLVFVPVWLFVIRGISAAALMRSWFGFWDKVLHWREELWNVRDPAPFLWFWLIESPIEAAMKGFWCLVAWLGSSSAG